MLSTDLLREALEIIEKGDGSAALDMLRNWITAAASDDESPETQSVEDEGSGEHADEDVGGSEGDGAEGVAPPPEAKRRRARNSVEHPRVAETRALDEKVRAGRWAHASDEKNPAKIESCEKVHGKEHPKGGR